MDGNMMRPIELYSELESFYLVGARPHSESHDSPVHIDQDSFPGRWKVINFYENDFNKKSEIEFYEWHSMSEHFADLDAVVMFVSNDSIDCKLGWKENHVQLNEFDHWLCADPGMGAEPPLSHQLGAFNYHEGKNHRATFIIDPNNLIQHISISSAEINRSPMEALRIIENLQGVGVEETADGDPILPFQADEAINDLT